jgi:hypothetical protein
MQKAVAVGWVEERNPPRSRVIYMVGLANSTHPTLLWLGNTPQEPIFHRHFVLFGL